MGIWKLKEIQDIVTQTGWTNTTYDMNDNFHVAIVDYNDLEEEIRHIAHSMFLYFEYKDDNKHITEIEFCIALKDKERFEKLIDEMDLSCFDNPEVVDEFKKKIGLFFSSERFINQNEGHGRRFG